MIIIAYGFRYNLDERSKERCKHIWHGQIYTGYRSRISIKTFDSNAQFERNKRFMMISTRSNVRQRGLGNDASSATTWYHLFSMETTPNVDDVLSGRPGNWAVELGGPKAFRFIAALVAIRINFSLNLTIYSN